MGLKALGFFFYWSSVFSLAYSMYSYNSTIANFGVAISWLIITLTLLMLVLSLTALLAGNEDQKKKIKESMHPGGRFKIAFGVFKSMLIFSLLCFNGFIITAIFYGLCTFLFKIACSLSAEK